MVVSQPALEPEVAVSPSETIVREEAAAPQTLAEEGASFQQKAGEETLPPARRITAIDPVPLDDEVKVYIVGDGSFQRFKAFHLINPPRVALDLSGVQSALKKTAFPI